jgi:YD repeat-containing protein
VMRSSTGLFLCLFLAVFSLAGFTQVNPNLETGLRPYGSYDSNNFDSVGLSNFDLTLHIPVLSLPQRGSLPLVYGITFNGKGWWVKETCHGIYGCDFQWEPPSMWQPGVGPHNTGAVFEQMYGPPTVSAMLNGNGTAYLYTANTWDGATHQMFQRTSTGGGMFTMDNTGISSDGSPTTQLPTWTRTRDGSLYTLSSGQYEDSNGNYYNRTVDTMGRSLTFSTSSADSSGCAGPLPISSATITNYPGYNGGSLQVKTCSATLTLSTNFQQADPDGEGYLVTEYTGNATVLQSLVICNNPSGTCSDWTTSPKWVFAYDSYADVTQVTLPTGGTVSYNWGVRGQCMGSGLTQVSMALSSRTIDDGNGPKTTFYSTGQYTPPASAATVVTDPLGNQTVHTFTALGGGCSNYETQTQWYQGGQSGGTLLKTVSTTYGRYLTTQAGDGTLVAINVEPTVITTTWPNGQSSRIERDYDSNLTVGTGTASYGKVTEERVFDYSGALLRKTDNNYLAFSNSSYMNQNLLDLATSETVYDGSGQLAQTTYGYDEYQLASSGVTTQHDMNVPNPGTRGNRTSVHRWLNTGGTPTTTTVFYDTGKPYQVTDPGGHTTTYTYSSAYFGAYVTQTNFPDTGSPAVHHVISGLYDLNTGLLTSFTDQNGKISTYGYDALSRIRSASFPDGGQTTFVPNDTPLAMNVERRDEIDASNWTDTYVKFDGLGRVIRKMTANGEGTPWDQVDTCYDADSRVSFTSYAYQGNGLSDPLRCSGAGDSFGYDALNRTLSVTHSDGSVINTEYTGAATQVTDEGNGISRVQRISQVDGLGRLTSVCEVTNSTLIGITPTPAACGQAISATGFLTTYQYNGLGNLLSVSQGGLNPRSFVYDSLSRLISATNPESGITTYTYNPDSLLYQRTRPAPNQTNPSLTETTTYTYDELHRLTGQTYTPNASGTPAVTIAYDQSSAFGVALENPIGRKSSEFTTGLSGTLSGAVYSYDEMGRVWTNSQCTPQNCGTSVFPVAYTYNKAGGIVTATNGMGTTLTYGYNIAPRLTSLTSSLSDSNHPGTLLSGAHYNPAGALLSTALGNGLNETRSYDSRLRLASIAVGAVYNVTIPSSNGYAPNGDILAANDSVNGNWTYTYDNFNRLLTAVATGQSYSYDYDRFGNRWHQNGPQSSQLSFDANNHVAAGNGVFYDAAGNVTNDGFHSYMYDDENRLTGVDVSPGNPPTPGTGTVTISGAEQKKNNCLAPVGGFSSAGASPQSCPWIYDYGSVSITINGYRQSVPYSQGSTASGIASSLISAFNGDPASPVTASGGTTITFTSKQVGSGSNYAFSTSVTYDTRDFTQASFAASPTSGSPGGRKRRHPARHSQLLLRCRGTAYSEDHGRGNGGLHLRFGGTCGLGGVVGWSMEPRRGVRGRAALGHVHGWHRRQHVFHVLGLAGQRACAHHDEWQYLLDLDQPALRRRLIFPKSGNDPLHRQRTG